MVNKGRVETRQANRYKEERNCERRANPKRVDGYRPIGFFIIDDAAVLLDTFPPAKMRSYFETGMTQSVERKRCDTETRQPLLFEARRPPHYPYTVRTTMINGALHFILCIMHLHLHHGDDLTTTTASIFLRAL
jgi:hypothetical protein